MSVALLIAATPGELRAARVEDGRLLDFRLARLVGASLVGAIYLGRVIRLLPALRAALVEIGLERPAYLSAEDAVPRGNLAALHEGATVLAQVKRDARADKAAAVTLRPRLVGRDLEWTPLRPGVAADSVAEGNRTAVTGALAPLLRAGEGVRALGGAAVAASETLAAEVAALRTRWEAIETERRSAHPPRCLERIDPLAVLLEEFVDPSLDAIAVDDAAAFAEIRRRLASARPELAQRLRHHRDSLPLFEAHGVADAVAALGELDMPLPGGGALAFEPTSAAVFIDVDSGSLAEERASGDEALLTANLEAALAIARQIRLRGLAGAIVVDFIGVRKSGARQRLLNAFRKALAEEVGDAQLLGWTALGHVELIRPRRRAPLHEILFERGPRGGLIKTALTVALEALAAAARQAEREPARALALRVHPEVASLLQGEVAAAREELEARLGRRLGIAADPARTRESFEIVPA